MLLDYLDVLTVVLSVLSVDGVELVKADLESFVQLNVVDRATHALYFSVEFLFETCDSFIMRVSALCKLELELNVSLLLLFSLLI